jgi:hypothetical protein
MTSATLKVGSQTRSLMAKWNEQRLAFAGNVSSSARDFRQAATSAADTIVSDILSVLLFLVPVLLMIGVIMLCCRVHLTVFVKLAPMFATLLLVAPLAAIMVKNRK